MSSSNELDGHTSQAAFDGGDQFETEWMPLLDRVRASTSLTAPIDLDGGDGRTVIAPIVAELSDEEREFFQGFVEECAASVAAELSHYDAHLDCRVDRLPRATPSGCPPQKLPFDSHGQPGFWNGKTYITPDRDGHRGGVWKMYKGDERLGTFDAQLNRID